MLASAGIIEIEEIRIHFIQYGWIFPILTNFTKLSYLR